MKKIYKIIIIICFLNIFCYKYSEYNIKVSKDYLLELSIPKINFTKKVYNLDDKRNNLNDGVKLLKPLILPDKNNSYIIIAGHNGNSKISHFKNLYKVKIKDEVIIDYNNQKYIYEIVEIYDIIKNGKALIKNNYKNIVVLITCKGYNKQTIYIGRQKN